jgi:hypothetical protein
MKQNDFDYMQMLKGELYVKGHIKMLVLGH